MRWSRTPTAAALLLALAACGDSGSSGTTGVVGAFAGPYKAAGFRATFEFVQDVRTVFGQVASDGTSIVAGTIDENDNGTVFPGSPSSDGFLLLADGTLTFSFAGTDFLRGCLSPDNQVAVLGSILAGEDPFFLALVRCWAGVAATSDLVGTYHVVSLRKGSDLSAAVGTATFDGFGAGAIQPGVVGNDEGVITVAGVGAAFTYAVAADGATTLAATATATFEGGLLEGGDLLLLSGSTTSGGDPQVLAFLETAAAATDATLDGTYCMVGIAYDLGGPSFRSFTGTAVADGAGSLTVEGTTNEEGTITDDPPEVVTYAVAANGSLTVTTPGGTLQGAVSADGRFALVGGGVSAGSDPLFYVLVRK